MKGFILGALVVGVAAVLIYKVVRKSSKKTTNENIQNYVPSDVEPLIIPPDMSNAENLTDQRAYTAVSISERHEEANAIITDTLNNIFNEDDDETVIISENESDLNDILSDLDKLSE